MLSQVSINQMLHLCATQTQTANAKVNKQQQTSVGKFQNFY